MKRFMKNMFNFRVRLWIAFLIAIMMVGPAFIIGWAAGIHDGFDTGAKVKTLEIRNALIEGMRDRLDFFIGDIKDIGFHPNGEGKLGICTASVNNDRTRKVSIIKQ